MFLLSFSWPGALAGTLIQCCYVFSDKIQNFVPGFKENNA